MKNENSQTLAIKTGYFDPQVWTQIKSMAETFFISKALPSYVTNAPQLVMMIQAGYEMGMKPVEAIKSLYMVNGQINIWGSAMIRRLREHGWSVAYKMSTDDGGACTATVIKDKETYTETFSFKSAEKSGYTKGRDGSLKVGWREGVNRNLKLRYGAISMLIKTYIPEVLGSASELVEIAEDYEIVDANPVVADTSNKVIKTDRPSKDPGDLTGFLQNSKKEVTPEVVKK